MSTFDPSNFEETITSMVDGNCPADLECGPADRWHEDVRDEIMSRISIVDVEDADDAVSRLEDWRDSLDRGDLTEHIYTEIVYSSDCEDFVREYESECDDAVFSMYGDYSDFVLSVSPASFASLVDALANVGIDHVLRGQVYEWAANLSDDIDGMISDIEESIMRDEEEEEDN